MKIAFVTGCSGMDGSHLCEFLLGKGYEVHGLIRRHSTDVLWRIEGIRDELHLHQGDMLDYGSLARILKEVQPDEIYNLAAQSYVAHSFDAPVYTGNVTGVGALRLVEAVRENCPNAKVYQASSSEQFGKVRQTPQNEDTPFYPRSPYGCAKVFAHWTMRNYRDAYHLPIYCGICFNHESERRGLEFVSRKICNGVAKIHLGLQKKIKLGNMDSKRDWGYAPDYVEGMWIMLQGPPMDYVLSTGVTRSIKEFLTEACKAMHLPNHPMSYYEKDERFFRPSEVDYLRGDSRRINKELGWYPKTSFEEMVKRMVDSEWNRLAKSL